MEDKLDGIAEGAWVEEGARRLLRQFTQELEQADKPHEEGACVPTRWC